MQNIGFESKTKIEQINSQIGISKERISNNLKEKEEELAKLSEKLSAKELEIEDKKKKVELDTDARYERLSEINTYDVNFENLEKTKKNVKQELQITVSELDSNRIKKQDIAKNFLEIDNTRNKAIKKLEEIKDKI